MRDEWHEIEDEDCASLDELIEQLCEEEDAPLEWDSEAGEILRSGL
jgi:hypothetical protein